MGFNRSGTTFFHNLLSKSKQFTTSTTWDFVVPSISLKKCLWFFRHLLLILNLDQLEKKEKGHKVGLDDIEEDEMLIFLHKLDSKWISNNLVPWMKYDSKFKSFTRELYIDSKNNEKRNIDSMRFVKQFWKRQTVQHNHKQLLSKSNPFVFRLKSIMKVFPDAKIIFIVRDPIETITSFFSMQERIKYGNMMTKEELDLYRIEAYQEIIDWYQETENAKQFLDKNNFLVLKYDDLKEDLYGSVDQSFKFIGQDMNKEFESLLSEKSSMKHIKKHQNKTINDFGFTEKQIKEDFAFVYEEYFS
ncbi:MAG: sulfotransferase [Candidatus Marinimicrobia bacterium]|nr:sulfotransferase [Candidatus Neomarinimicrobiota bacterium]